MTTSTEHHEEKARGRWHTIELCKMVPSGLITPTEYYLVGLIESLVNFKKEGCWASNAWLAKECGVTDRQIRYMIHHLLGKDTLKEGNVVRKGVNVLKEVGWKMVGHERRRVLVTIWSNAKLPGGEGEEIEFPPSPETDFPPPPGNRLPPINKRKKRNKRESPPSPPRGEHVRGFMEEPQEGESPLKSEAQQLVDILYRGLVEKSVFSNRSKPKLSDWVKEFQVGLQKDSFEDLKTLIQYHVTNLDRPYHPQLLCARTFVTEIRRVKNAKRRRELEERQREGIRETQDDRW